MNPEDKARQDIDRQLGQCGWVVQDKGQMNISAALGVAVREFPMLTGEVDYLLYVNGKAIGVLEAKPKGHPLIGVETQASKYSGALPPAVPAYRSPLPFAYESTGAVTQFTNLLEPDARSREVFTFHRPEELLRLVSLDAQVRGKLKALPALDASKLWSVQKRAIENLERSLAKHNPRSLIQMATGSGKTFTAVNACYRLIKFGGARRALFLVDRSNLGRQTYREFQQFVSPVNAYIEAKLKRAARLRQGILKRPFEGCLVPQDPTDEPAALLIGRVRRERCSSYQVTIGSSRSRQGRKSRKACTLPLFDSPVVGSQDEVRLD